MGIGGCSADIKIVTETVSRSHLVCWLEGSARIKIAFVIDRWEALVGLCRYRFHRSHKTSYRHLETIYVLISMWMLTSSDKVIFDFSEDKSRPV